MGVAGADLNLFRISSFLADNPIGQNGIEFIVERREPNVGLLVGISTGLTRQVDGQRINASQSEQQPVRDAATYLLTRFGSWEDVEDADNAMQFELGKPETLSCPPLNQLDPSSRDNCYLVQVQDISDTDGLRWMLVVVVPEKDFLGDICKYVHCMVALTWGQMNPMPKCAGQLKKKVTIPVNQSVGE